MELIGRLVATIGVDRAAAAKVVGGIVQLPYRDAEEAHAFIARMPRAAAVAHTSQTDSNSAGMFATLGGGVTGAGSRMMAAGPGMVPAAACGALRYARETAGKHAVGDIVGAIPSRVQ